MAEEYLTDDEQLEAVKRAFSEYAPWILGGVVLGIGGWFGWRYHHTQQDEQGLRAAAQFSQMNGALQANDAKKSRDIGTALIKDFPGSPYADQARLTLARIAVEDGRSADAVPPLTAVMDHSKDGALKQVARLRLARVLIDQGKPDEAIKLLDTGAPGSFAGRYHEIRGDALSAKQDPAAAAKEYTAALSAGDAADGPLLQLKLADLAANPKATP